MAEPKVLTELNVKDLTGKNGLVAFFFPRANSEGCTIEANEFNEHLDDFKVLGFNVVGVSVSKVKDNQQFIGKQHLKFPLVSDLDKKITTDRFNNIESKKMHGFAGALGIKHKEAMRTTFIMDPDGKILQTLREVNPISSARDALDAIGEIEKASRIKDAAINKGVNKAAAKTEAKNAKAKKPRKSK